MYSKPEEETSSSKCLECGKEVYGRSDKKFCCGHCKNKYHYEENRKTALYHDRIIRLMNINYRILTQLLSMGIDTISIQDVLILGFHPEISTSSERVDEEKDEKRCFDIQYHQTSKRILRINKISL